MNKINNLISLETKLQKERRLEHLNANDELRLYKLLQETQEAIINFHKELHKHYNIGDNQLMDICIKSIENFNCDNYIMMIADIIQIECVKTLELRGNDE